MELEVAWESSFASLKESFFAEFGVALLHEGSGFPGDEVLSSVGDGREAEKAAS